MYTKLVAEGSSGSTPAPGSELIMTPFPAALLSSLRPLVSFLRSLPLPSTHPSNPAAQAILSTLKEAQRGYADMRGNWSKKCLEGQGRRLLDRAETVDTVITGRDFGQWIETLLSVIEVRKIFHSKHPINSFPDGIFPLSQEEYKLLAELLPLPAPPVLAFTYITLLSPVLTLFSDTIASLISLIKRSLPKYTFLALASYESLVALQPRWDAMLARRGTAGKEKEGNELKDGLQALRAVCLRSFPEFLADIKIAATGKGGELATGVAEFAISVIVFPVMAGG